MKSKVYEDGREFDNGDTKEIDGVLMEVSAVSYTETPEGKKQNFSYTWEPYKDAEARRKAERKHQESSKK